MASIQQLEVLTEIFDPSAAQIFRQLMAQGTPEAASDELAVGNGRAQ